MATRAKDARGGKGAHRKSFSSGYRWWGYWPPFSPLPDEVYGPASMGGRVTSPSVAIAVMGPVRSIAISVWSVVTAAVVVASLLDQRVRDSGTIMRTQFFVLSRSS